MKTLALTAFRVLFAVLTVVAAQAADSTPASAARIERLSRLCRVWGTARYLHPALTQTNIDWDAALVAAIPKAGAARDDQEFVDAVGAMLKALNDPVTCVVKKDFGKAGATRASQARQILSLLDGGCVVVHLNRSESEEDFLKPETTTALRKELAKARNVIVDLRGVSWAAGALAKISQLLPLSRKVSVPTQRYVAHSGYKPSAGTTTGGYDSKFETDSVKTVVHEQAPPVVFLFDAQSSLPIVALALRQAGNGWLVAQGPVDESVLVFHQSVPLALNLEARIRTSDLVLHNKTLVLATDAVVDADADHSTNGPAFKAALGLIRGTMRSSTPAPANDSAPPPTRRADAVRFDELFMDLLDKVKPSVVTSDKPYHEMLYPDSEHRLLALFRFWNVIHFFYPYQHLMDEPWENALPRFIPKFEAARDALAYELVCAELSTFVPDGHTVVNGPELRRVFGDAVAPVMLRRVENLPVVTDFFDEAAATAAGIKKGDVVLTMDGQPMGQAVEKFAKYLTASTATALAQRKLSSVLQGAHGSTVKLTVHSGDDQTREVQLTRRREFYQTPPRRSGEAFRILPGNIGYADLERLKPDAVNAMFEKLNGTTALIFDLRGYPQGTAWAIAPRLSARAAPVAAVFRRNLVTGKNPADTLTFPQPIPTTTKPKYPGKTVTLIDDRAISQAEHTGLFFEVACNTTFIGSPTAGANGDVTSFVLPGRIRVGFTGHDVRHADGRQLQRVGLIPHIEVKPTLAGIRSGRDEVLERAVRFLQEGK